MQLFDYLKEILFSGILINSFMKYKDLSDLEDYLFLIFFCHVCNGSSVLWNWCSKALISFHEIWVIEMHIREMVLLGPPWCLSTFIPFSSIRPVSLYLFYIQVPVRNLLNTLIVATTTTPSHSLFQIFTTRCVKILPIRSHLNSALTLNMFHIVLDSLAYR